MKGLVGCVAVLLLAGCKVSQGQPAPDGEKIACALDGADEFTPDCVVDRAQVDGTLMLIVRHPDGGFRRFEVLKDGHGLAAADGADQARLSINGEFLEADVAEDRYLFPATIGGSGGAH